MAEEFQNQFGHLALTLGQSLAFGYSDKKLLQVKNRFLDLVSLIPCSYVCQKPIKDYLDNRIYTRFLQ